ncbi:UNVERIFIED_CONTAM: hypothetical protein Sradi_4279000 [Sesamum radiatum]|uniref:Josephin-like protein n=1 Tax=Sesamum radiatum TaxID=300843 RepID=A0AAW2NKG4_SESRA
MSSRRVSFSPEPTIHSNNNGANIKVGGNKKKVMLKIWIFKLPKGSRFSPVSFFKQIGAKVVGALPLLSTRRRCSRKVSSASLARSRSYAETLDSQRAEAIEDCIEFLNSSSLQRSNSVSSSC